MPLRNWEGVKDVPAGTSDKPGDLVIFHHRNVTDSPLRTTGAMNKRAKVYL